MKKLFFLIVAIIGFCAITFAQNPCYIRLAVINNCDSPEIVPHADITITLYDDYNCIDDPLNPILSCSKEFYGLDLPITNQIFSLKECTEYCADYLSIKINVKFRDEHGYYTCVGETCENFSSGEIYTVNVP